MDLLLLWWWVYTNTYCLFILKHKKQHWFFIDWADQKLTNLYIPKKKSIQKKIEVSILNRYRLFFVSHLHKEITKTISVLFVLIILRFIARAGWKHSIIRSETISDERMFRFFCVFVPSTAHISKKKKKTFKI